MLSRTLLFAVLRVASVALLLAASPCAAQTEGAEAHYKAGIEHFSAGRLTDAAVEFEVARRLDPAHAGAFFYLGATRYKLGDASRALPLLRKGLALDPDLDGDIARTYLGLCLESLKLYRTARATYAHVVRLDPDSRLGRRAQARIDAIDLVFRRFSGSIPGGFYLATGTRAYLAGRHQEAVDHLGEFRALHRAFPDAGRAEVGRAAFFLAASLNHVGQHREALEVLEEARFEPAAVGFHRGWGLFGLGRHADARRALMAARRQAAPASTWGAAIDRLLSAVPPAQGRDGRPNPPR